MVSESRSIATAWFERADEDITVARHLLSQGFGLLTAASLLQQAVERYLKGYLLAIGWELKKTHDLELLISEVIARDKDFQSFLEVCRRLTEYYTETRYPPIVYSDLTPEEVTSSLREAELLIDLIRRKSAP